MADVQRRLLDLGVLEAGERTRFDDETVNAVRVFQQSRNLPADGIVGPLTWDALIEAGWRLGDRVLYERHPPWLRGDDIAELQERLGNLGFTVGKIDGIFGPLARHAVTEFQRNSGLAPDGVAGVELIRMLTRVGTAPAGKPNLTVHERLAVRARGAGLGGRRVFIDPRSGGSETGAVTQGGLVESDFSYLVALEVSQALGARQAETMLSRAADTCPTPSERAALANWFGSDVVIGVGLASEPGDLRAMVLTSYFGTHRFSSTAGESLARGLGEHCALASGYRSAPPQPASTPLLRETRAVAVQLEFAPADNHDRGDEAVNGNLASSIAGAVVESLDDFFTTDHVPA